MFSGQASDALQQRVRPPAEPGQDVLRQVSGMVPGFPGVSRPGQRARDGNCEDEDEPEAAPVPLPRVRDQREYLQQARDLPGFPFIGAGRGGIAAMRDWHGGMGSFASRGRPWGPSDLTGGPVDEVLARVRAVVPGLVVERLQVAHEPGLHPVAAERLGPAGSVAPRRGGALGPAR